MDDRSNWRDLIPTIPGTIRRTRLLNQLRRLQEYQLVLINAPPGYGKTTLVSQYVEELNIPVAWHTVTSRDLDLPYFHHHALRLLSPILGSDVGRRDQSVERPPFELVAQLLSILEEYQTPLLYVIDNAHNLAGAEATSTWLHVFSGSLPSNVRLILLSQIVLPLPYSDLLAHNKIVSLEHEALRFTEDESQELAVSIQGETLGDEQLQYLMERLDGWPAGIAMALQPASTLHRELPGGTSPPEALFATLAEPVVQSQLPDMKRFLLASSTLDVIIPELCETALDIPDAANRLSNAYQRGLFLSRVEGGYTFHSLFRDYLQSLLKTEDPQRYRDYHLAAARRYEERDDLDLAFEHYMQADRTDLAIHIVEQAASAFYAEGHHERLLYWFNQLQHQTGATPNLNLATAWVYTDRYEYESALSALDQANEQYRKRNNDKGLAEVTLQKGRILLQRGEYDEAKETIKPLLNISSPSHRGRALRIMGSSNLWLGNIDRSITQLEEAKQLHEEAGLISALSHVLQDLYVAYNQRGDLDTASDYLQRVVAIRRKLRAKGALALALNDLGYYYYLRADYELAYRTLIEGMTVASSTADRRPQSYLLASLADLYRDLGLFSKASTLYDQAVSALNQRDEPRLHWFILLSLARMRFWQTRYNEALMLCTEASELAVSIGLKQDMGLVKAQKYLTQVFLGEVSAIEELVQLVDELSTAANRIEQTHAEVLLAVACLRVNNQELARHTLRKAVKNSEEIGSPHPIVIEAANNPLLENILREMQSIPHLSALHRLQETASKLRQEISVEEPALSVNDSPTGHIEILTLGEETIKHSDGYIVREADWRTNSARELFFYLLFNGSTPRNEIGLLLWPESTHKQVKSNVYLTIHRIRQAAGNRTVLYEDGAYSINPSFSIWCDALEFEEFVRKASLLPPNDARAEELWRKAIILYQGEFLPSLDSSWLANRRESLSESYIDALANYGKCAFVREDYDTALVRYLKALEIDPYREEVHRSILRCYAGQGENSRVMRHFLSFKESLLKELDILPSEKTQHLVQRLLSL